ncbi:DUF58 domain-containing protein [Mycobacterium lepromatosis]|nr:DUF58 domain-containing protein [Mycobacterium lepromatosis]
MRSIDWHATSRRANVMVRTYRPAHDRQVVIVLDIGRMTAGSTARLVDGRRPTAGSTCIANR